MLLTRPGNTITPTTIHVTTVPCGWTTRASVNAFFYMEHIPFRCVASHMQLFHNTAHGTADLASVWPPNHVSHPHAAPSGELIRIRPGDLLIVDGHTTYRVHVTEGTRVIYPSLHRIDS